MRIKQLGAWQRIQSEDWPQDFRSQMECAAAAPDFMVHWIGQPSIIIRPPGSYGTYDPLTQYGTVGIKGVADISLWTWLRLKFRR